MAVFSISVVGVGIGSERIEKIRPDIAPLILRSRLVPASRYLAEFGDRTSLAGRIPVIRKDLIQAWLSRRYFADDLCGLHEVSVMDVLVDRIATPSPAAHGQRKWHTVCERPTRGECVCLINNHSAGRDGCRQDPCAAFIGRM